MMLEIYKNSVKDIVINHCWKLNGFSYSIIIVNKLFFTLYKTTLYI